MANPTHTYLLVRTPTPPTHPRHPRHLSAPPPPPPSTYLHHRRYLASTTTQSSPAHHTAVRSPVPHHRTYLLTYLLTCAYIHTCMHAYIHTYIHAHTLASPLASLPRLAAMCRLVTSPSHRLPCLVLPPRLLVMHVATLHHTDSTTLHHPPTTTLRTPPPTDATCPAHRAASSRTHFYIACRPRILLLPILSTISSRVHHLQKHRLHRLPPPASPTSRGPASRLPAGASRLPPPTSCCSVAGMGWALGGRRVLGCHCGPDYTFQPLHSFQPSCR